MADTTPDSSRTDRLSVVVRSVDGETKSHERLLSTVIANEKTGAALAENITAVLQAKGLYLEKLIFQSYDFASAMSGEFNGAQKHVSDLSGHEVMFIPCQTHRENTFTEHACNSSSVISELFNVLEDIHTFVTGSTKRFEMFKTNISNIENDLHLENLSRTRWTARAKSLKAVVASLEMIVQTLADISNANGCPSKVKAKAQGLRKIVLSFDFVVSTYFMKNILYKMKILTEQLESKEMNVVDAAMLIDSVIKSLEKIEEDSEGMDNLIESAKQFSLNLGIDVESDFNQHHRRRLKPLKLDDKCDTAAEFTLVQFYKREFKLVLDKLVILMKDNVTSFLNTTKPIQQLFQQPFNRKACVLANVQSLLDMIPKSISMPDAETVQSELEILADNCSNAKSLEEIMLKSNELKSIIPKANSVVQLCGTAPVTVSTNERSFGQLNFVMNPLRSTMGEERLDSLLSITCEKDIVDNVDIKKLVKRWYSVKKRRVHFQSESE